MTAGNCGSASSEVIRIEATVQRRVAPFAEEAQDICLTSCKQTNLTSGHPIRFSLENDEVF